MVALSTYVAQTQRLLQNPPATDVLYATSDIQAFVNTARGQLALESKCIRFVGTLSLASPTRTYNFSSITLPGSSGIAGVLDVEQAWTASGSGFVAMVQKSFPYFVQYFINLVTPNSGRPKYFARYAEGIAGSLYFDPIPDASYTASLDCVGQPSDLSSDGDVDAIKYPFSDAVPFFAAYYAYMSAQRTQDADHMYQMYEIYKKRARDGTAPDVLPQTAPQQPDLTLPNKLGMSRKDSEAA